MVCKVELYVRTVAIPRKLEKRLFSQCILKCKMPRHNLFSNEEMRDMVCVYAKENFNGRREHRRYLEMYPNRRQPDFKIFKNLYDRLGETGSFRPKRNSAGRRKTLNLEQEEEILVRVAENPDLSTRRIAMEIGVSKLTV
ncbi:hypothetical protein NQ318_010440 [Aromia moschata]|uniref:HTH psq-type domain-containing protein n=1 Tax=Aromia moschata TaxID=1265417 RepID=A0AAV8Y5S5_9CUCU|nr:hypothetical protein NQ318_010440 [Aromia moschata]